MSIPETNLIAVQRGTDDPRGYWTADDSPAGFAGFLYDAAKRYLQDGDTVHFRGQATLFKDREWRLPSIELVGVDQPDGTRSEILTSCCIDALAGKTVGNTPSIVLAKQNIFRNLRLVGRCCLPEEDAAITGHDQLGDTFVLFDRCEIDAGKDQDWGAYYRWRGNVNQNGFVGFNACTGSFSRFFCAICPSASPQARLHVTHSKFYGDGNGSFTGGATNMLEHDASVCPFLMRSGTARFVDVETWCKGYVGKSPAAGFGVNRVVGLISNVYSSKGGPVTVTGKDAFVRQVVQGHARETWDIDVRYDSPPPAIDNRAALTAAKGGSGPGGELRVWTPAA